MSTTLLKSETHNRAKPPTQDWHALARKLDQLATEVSTLPELYEQAFRQLATGLDAIYGCLDVRLGASVLSDEYRSPLSGLVQIELMDAMLMESQVTDGAAVRSFQTNDRDGLLAISVPLKAGGECAGAIVLVIQAADCDENALIKRFEQFGAFIDQLAERRRAEGNSIQQEDQVVDALAKATAYENETALAFALTNSLARRLNCIEVVAGRVNGNKISVLSISGLEHFTANSPGIVAIRQAMEECLDRQAPIVVQQDNSNGIDSSGHLLHRRWHEKSGSSPVMSIPLRVGDRITSVFSFRRPSDIPFSSQDLEHASAAVQPFAASIEVLHQARRGFADYFRGWSSQLLDNLRNPRSRVGLAVRVAAVVGVAWFFLGWAPYKVPVPCDLHPAITRHIVAPFSGTIAETMVVPGDTVEAGDALVRFRDDELQLRHEATIAQIEAATLAMNQALSEGAVDEAAIQRAQLEVYRIDLAETKRQLDESVMRAPCKGVVISGDLTQEVGRFKQLGEQLMQISADDNMLVRLNVPEHFGVYIEPGMKGEFACLARPGDSMKCEVISVTPDAAVVDGKRIFYGEATVDTLTEWARPGMEGVARINAGRKPVFWIYLHQLFNAVRARLWL